MARVEVVKVSLDLPGKILILIDKKTASCSLLLVDTYMITLKLKSLYPP